MIDEKEALAIFNKTGAYLKGHFILTSGLHSEYYLQCAKVLQYPDYAEVLCKELAGLFRDEKPTAVAAPALGGIIVAHEVARQLNAKAVFTERSEGKMVLRRGFELGTDDRVLVVEDVITTAGSVKEVMDVVEDAGARVIGVGSLVNRSGKKLNLGIKCESILELDIPTFAQEKCPLCKKGYPVSKPGSRGLEKR